VLAKMRLSPVAIEGIMESVGKKDFQVACRRQFEGRFPGFVANNVGNHPNAYVEEAQRALKEAAAAAGGGAAAGASGAAAAGGAVAGVAAAGTEFAAASTATPAKAAETGGSTGAAGGAGAAAAMQLDD
jgi:hypothetical protein